jgi:hypothetical protein
MKELNGRITPVALEQPDRIALRSSSFQRQLLTDTCLSTLLAQRQLELTSWLSMVGAAHFVRLRYGVHGITVTV